MKHILRPAASLLLALTLAVSDSGTLALPRISAAEIQNWYQTWSDLGNDGHFRYAATDDFDFYKNGFGAIVREYFDDEQVIRVPAMYLNECIYTLTKIKSSENRIVLEEEQYKLNNILAWEGVSTFRAVVNYRKELQTNLNALIKNDIEKERRRTSAPRQSG